MGVNKNISMIFSLLSIGVMMPLASMNTLVVHRAVPERGLCHEILDCMTFIDGSFSLEEDVDDMYKGRDLLIAQGFDVPLLSVILEKSFENNKPLGVYLEGDFTEELYALVFLRESGISYCSRFHPEIIQVKKKSSESTVRWMWDFIKC